jgi:hypothetical protein
MNKSTLIKALFGAGLFLAGSHAWTNSGGGNTGLTGSPLSGGATCSGCHSGGANTGQGFTISSDIPPSGFVPSTNYTITIQANANNPMANRMGFMASVEGTGGHRGAVVAPNNQVAVVGNSWVNQTSSGNLGIGGIKEWTFTWNSGASSNPATVYTSVNFSNNNSTTSGDFVLTQNLVLTPAAGVGQDEWAAIQPMAYPNPTAGVVRLALPEGVHSLGLLECYNVQGRRVLTADPGLFAQGATEWPVDLTQLPPGMYLLRMEVNGIPTTTQVLKQN